MGRIRRKELRKRRRRQRAVIGAISLSLTIVLVAAIILASSPKTPGFAQSNSYEAKAYENATTVIDLGLLPVSLHSSNAIIVNVDLNDISRSTNSPNSLNNTKVLFELSADEKIYPASLTKIMTAMVVLESKAGKEEMITLGQDIYNEILPQDLKTAGLSPEESLSVKDLLYGMMLESGADCALGLARHIAGSETAFGGLMNEKAAELGMDHTSFTNATGRHEPEQYSTVRDICVLLNYAIGNEAFYEIFTSQSYKVASTNIHPNGITFTSSIFGKTSGDFGEALLLGGKTGFTAEAGQCLASLWAVNGERYIIVTAGAQAKNSFSEAKHLDDAMTLIRALWPDYSFPEPTGRPEGSIPPL